MPHQTPSLYTPFSLLRLPPLSPPPQLPFILSPPPPQPPPPHPPHTLLHLNLQFHPLHHHTQIIISIPKSKSNPNLETLFFRFGQRIIFLILNVLAIPPRLNRPQNLRHRQSRRDAQVRHLDRNPSSQIRHEFSKKKFTAAAVDGKIYVAGGRARSAAVEEFNPDENVWRVVANTPRRRYGCIGASLDGVFYVIGGLKIANCESGGSAAIAAAREYASSMDQYKVAARVWLRSRSVPGGGCVVAACAVGDKHVYVLSSHEVELSFWRFEGRRRSAVFGEWCRIRSPPLPAQVRLDSSVRFSCVGVGDKVVLIYIQVVDVMKEWLVLVYDDCGGCGGGEWSRVADLPEVMRRAAVVCVER